MFVTELLDGLVTNAESRDDDGRIKSNETLITFRTGTYMCKEKIMLG